MNTSYIFVNDNLVEMKMKSSSHSPQATVGHMSESVAQRQAECELFVLTQKLGFHFSPDAQTPMHSLAETKTGQSEIVSGTVSNRLCLAAKNKFFKD